MLAVPADSREGGNTGCPVQVLSSKKLPHGGGWADCWLRDCFEQLAKRKSFEDNSPSLLLRVDWSGESGKGLVLMSFVNKDTRRDFAHIL